MRGPARVAELGFGRHESFGLITDREVRLLRLLAPHLRRAVTISDLIDMKAIEAEALGRTLDMVPAGVVLVAEDAEILHANRMADRMLAEAAPIQSTSGRLSASDTKTAGELRAIVAAAARNEGAIGAAGIGMAIAAPDGPPATAHVLPIAQGDLRSRLLPKGAAAVFVASEGLRQPMSLAPVADLYGLSGAETRLLTRVMQGESLAEAAAALHVSQNTAKTHLSRIFAKTGTQRQAGLVALVNRLLPPVAPPDSGSEEIAQPEPDA
jgi:DNA-binding CsgD family transcriptional regulator